MPQLVANLSMFYPELDFLDRFEAAAKDGFKAVEYLFPYAFEPREIAARLNANGLQQVLFNAPPGDWVGCEYRPRAGMQPGGTSVGLGWLRPWL